MAKGKIFKLAYMILRKKKIMLTLQISIIFAKVANISRNLYL